MFRSTITDEERLLARIILGEGVSCSLPERLATGYVVVNRYRFHPKLFAKNLADVIGKPKQFEGIKTALFLLLASSKNIADKLTYAECALYRETLNIARDILRDQSSNQDSLFLTARKHAFFFNKASNDPPAKASSPLLCSKKTSGWSHSFYGYVPKIPPR